MPVAHLHDGLDQGCGFAEERNGGDGLGVVMKHDEVGEEVVRDEVVPILDTRDGGHGGHGGDVGGRFEPDGRWVRGSVDRVKVE